MPTVEVITTSWTVSSLCCIKASVYTTINTEDLLTVHNEMFILWPLSHRMVSNIHNRACLQVLKFEFVARPSICEKDRTVSLLITVDDVVWFTVGPQT